MFNKIFALFACFCLFAGAASASDWGILIEREEVSPTISLPASLWHGVRVGAVTGLTAGWVRYSGDFATQDVWNSAGFGALAGAGLSLSAELFRKRVMFNEVLSDTGYGGRIGASAGFLWGAATALVSGESERVGSSTAWGQLAGAAIGLIYGSYRAASGHYADEERPKGGLPLPFTVPVPQGFDVQPKPSGITIVFKKRF